MFAFAVFLFIIVDRQKFICYNYRDNNIPGSREYF